MRWSVACSGYDAQLDVGQHLNAAQPNSTLQGRFQLFVFNGVAYILRFPSDCQCQNSLHIL